jgi:hypothetical protein
MTTPKKSTPTDRMKRQQDRAAEGASAMADYRAAEKAERTKMDKLRAARLAREAVPAAPEVTLKVKKAAKKKKT